MQFSLESRSVSLSVGEFAGFSLGPSDAGGGPQGLWRAQLGQHWHNELQQRTLAESPAAHFEVAIEGRLTHRGWTFAAHRPHRPARRRHVAGDQKCHAPAPGRRGGTAGRLPGLFSPARHLRGPNADISLATRHWSPITLAAPRRTGLRRGRLRARADDRAHAVRRGPRPSPVRHHRRVSQPAAPCHRAPPAP